MCGICASFGPAEPAEHARMLSRLAHRGPDDEGAVHASGNAWLGHRRLSIVDLSGGAQPLSNESGDLWLVGNGEIYNHDEVRDGLDVEFATGSDNEAALAVIDTLGPRALGTLSGMFAVVAAGQDGRFVAARDPVGIKPLYWANEAGCFRFASEMCAFDPGWQRRVEVFPPGCYWTPDEGLVRFASAVPEAAVGVFNEPAAADAPVPDEVLVRVREVLVQAVESQMMGDVPVGVFLSGGLDSSIVAAIAQRYLERRGLRLKTFAVGLAGSNDLDAARRVAHHLGAEHHEHVYTADEVAEVVPDVVRTIEAFDPSLVRSAVPNYLLSRFTAQHVKVVLTGEGADELFAGYDYLRRFDDADDLHDELVRIVEGLHNLNLQRCDRVTMAFGLEARVPFLDRDVISLGLSIPAAWKIAGPGVPEKLALRAAFDGWLPHDILYRDKEEFGDGSGAASVLTPYFDDEISVTSFAEGREEAPIGLRSKEELAYFQIFQEHLPGVRPEQTLGRFATA